VLGFSAGRAPELRDSLLAQLANVLTKAPEGPENLQALLGRIGDATDRVPQFSDASVASFFTTIQNHHPTLVSIEPEARPALAELAGRLAAKVPERSDSSNVPLAWIVNALFDQDPPRGLQYAEESGAALPDPIRPTVIERLGQLVDAAQDEEARRRPARALVLVDRGAGSQRLSQAVSSMLSQERFPAAAEAIRDFHGDLPDTASLVDAYLATVANRGAINSVAAIQPLPLLSSVLSDEHWKRVSGFLSEMLVSGQPEAITTALGATKALEGRPEHQEVVRTVARYLSGTEYDANEVPVIAWTIENASNLDAAERGGLVNQLRKWLRDQAETRGQLSPSLGAFRGLTSDQRVDLVRDMLAAEASEQDVSVRVGLLLAAREQVHRARGRAREAVDARMKTLRSSGDDNDKAVVRDFDSRISETAE
jgi:hypothetical protein